MSNSETKKASRDLALALFKSVIFLCLTVLGPTMMLPTLARLLAAFQIPLTLPISAIFHLSVGLLMLWLFARFVEKRPWQDYGLSLKEPWQALTELYDGALIGSTMVALVTLILFALGCYHIVAINYDNDLPMLIPTFLLAALYEEILFRGYVLQTIEKASNTITAVLLSSLLFGMAHMGNFNENVPLLTAIASCMALSLDAGVLFCAAFLVTRRLWLPLGLHAFWNVFEGPVFGTPVSANEFGAPLFLSFLQGPQILTGGVFGPEASIIELVISLLFAWWLWRLRYNSLESL